MSRGPDDHDHVRCSEPAEYGNQVASYGYNARDETTSVTYPDHTGGNPGDAGYAAGSTGDDKVYFYDSENDDDLIADSDMATIDYGVRKVDAFAFDRVMATSEHGGYDQAFVSGQLDFELELFGPWN